VSFRVVTDVMVAMRDGVELATDLWIPDHGPSPTLLVRLPYGKNVFPTLPLLPRTTALLEAGYSVVWQDCRGTGRSTGEFIPHIDDPQDGTDTIAWLREQPWCDGNIGAYGLSYLGFVQWAQASRNPAGLKAIAPTVTSSDLYTAPWYSPGGAFSWHTAWNWATMQILIREQIRLASGTGDLDALIEAAGMVAEPEPHLTRLPISDQPLLAKQWPWWNDWLDHPTRDRFWQDLATIDRSDEVTVPALNVGGWFDPFVDSAAKTFAHMRASAGTPQSRQGQRLIIGPWDHLNQDGAYHDRQFGLAATAQAADLTGEHIRFFDRHVRARPDGQEQAAPVRIFVMGIDQWRDEQDWPLPDTTYTDYFLDSSGHANTADGDGTLSTQPPEIDSSDTYVYDPATPVATLGGRLLASAALNQVGPVDQRPVEARKDVLCFTTPELDEALEVTGHVSVLLYGTSSAADTDFTGKLVDVFPDGRAIYLTDGILRARYRRSLVEAEMLEPGAIYELRVDLSVTSNVFLPGHRIRLEISSSNFPRYDRNTNTGNLISDDGPEAIVTATNRVLHGPNHPSRVILPVIRR
jgi:uncharacterized protein